MVDARATVLERRSWDFEALARSERYGPYFRDPDYITGLVKELKQERKTATFSLVVALGAALVVLSGGLPKNATIAVAGMSLPLSFLSQQVVALVVAVASARATFAVLNASMMGRMLAKLADVMDQPNPEYFAAKHHAEALWNVLIRPPTEGFVSPGGERIGRLSLQLLSAVAVVVHFALVVAATFVALSAAIHRQAWLGIALSGLSAAVVLVCLLGTVFCLLTPIRYRWVEPGPRDSEGVDL